MFNLNQNKCSTSPEYAFSSGVLFLGLAKVKNMVQGYSSPKPFSLNEIENCIKYDIKVVDIWVERLQEYISSDNADILKGKRILELGPGSDLGVGLYLLSKNVAEYNAIDVNDLVQSVPKEFYVSFISHLKKNNSDIDESFLKNELENTREGNNNKLNFVCREDFDIVNALDSREIDIIFSQAAFEHFDDIDEAIQAISSVAVKGAKAVVLIDLKTHSRWIRDKDPNNIYRYPKWFYDLFYWSQYASQNCAL